MAIKQFQEFAGDRLLRQIDRKTVRDWISWLRRERGQSEATIRRRLGALSAIFRNSVEMEDVSLVNPFSRHRSPRAEEGYRLPFARSHLEKIDHWLESAGQGPTGQIIRLLRATGARPLEIGGLMASEIRLDAPIPFLLIQPNVLRRLKTASSQRLLPLVGDGLAVSREILTKTGEGAIFPERCSDTTALSARLNKALSKAGIPRTGRLTAYSFRHTLEEALRITDAPFDVQQAILGHAKRTITERYGARNVSLQRMRTAIESAGLALGDVDPSNYE